MKDNVQGFPKYHITKYGRLFSKKSGKWLERRGELAKGRLQYVLKDHGKTKIMKASRLVAFAYVKNPKPEEYTIVCHIDNNPTNNHYKNLYWGTQSMNIQQAVRENRFHQCKRFGKDNPMYGRKPWNTGKTWSQEIRDKISKATKGKKLSKEARENIRMGLMAKPMRKITDRKVRRIYHLRSLGWSQSRIANRVHLHQTQVSKILLNQVKHLCPH